MVLGASLPQLTLSRRKSTEHPTPGEDTELKWGGEDGYCHVRQMSWHSFPSSSVLGCLRSRHASAKLETGACCNWNIITTKQDYHEQRFQMGLEMILGYSEIISHSSSGEPSSPGYFSGGMALAFQALGQHPCPPFLAGKY